MFYFSHPSVLWFSLLAAIPIIIHIINLHRHKKILFSNVYLLKQLEKETKNIRRIRDLLLLLIRITIILSLVIIFAGPTLKTNTNTHKIKNNNIAFYIDNSFSMSLQNSKSTLFDFAKTYAKKIASSFHKNSSLVLITNDNIYSGLSLDEFFSQIDKIKISPLNPNFQLLSASIKTYQLGKLYLFSDFQKKDFSSFIPDSSCNYYIFPIQRDNVSDIILDTCYLSSAENTSSNELVFKVTNKSETPVTELPVKLFINSELKSIKNVTIEPMGYAQDTIKFTYSGKSETILGNLSIADYPVTFDNTLLFSYKIKNKFTLTVISTPQGFNSYKYISAAFSDQSNEAKFDIIKIPIGKIDELKTLKPDAVILDNITDLPPHFDDLIRNLLKNGTSIIFFPSPDNYKGASDFLTSISGGNIDKIDTSTHEIKKVEFSDKIFRNAIIKKKNVKFPVVKDILLVKNLPISSSVIIKTEDDFPVFFYNKSYKGLFTVYPLSLKSNKGFFESPLFFVSLYNTVTQKPSAGQLYYYCGKAYTITIPQKIEKDHIVKIRLYNKEKEFVPYQINTGNEINIVLKNNDITQAGFYKFYADTLENILAFNYNRSEADFTFLSPKELKNKFQNLDNVKIINTNLNLPLDFKPESDRDLTKYFISLALFLLLLETLVLKFYAKNKTQK
jgi:hypothetical protein